METFKLLEQIHNTYGLVTILKDMLWDLDGLPSHNRRAFTGILALIETVEEGMDTIKTKFESAVTIQGK